MSKKLAAIDIGTNSFHLVIVEIFDNGNFEIVDNEKEVIRLSEGSTGDIKYIQPKAIERGISALKKFAGIAKSHNAEIKAVATSAVREASNKIDFIQKVLDETGISISVISGVEEGRLIYQGVLQAVPVFNKKVLCIDIGGGSTEFVVGYKGKILYANSLKLGAVRLTKMFFENYSITNESIENCKKWVEGVLFPISKIIKNFNIDLVVGSSGTIMASGLMIKAMLEKKVTEAILNNYTFNFENLKKVEKNILKRKTVDERKKINGLDSKRADIIPAGVILLSTIFEQLNFSEIIISGYALREGIIFDSVYKEFPNVKKLFTKDIKNESVEKLAKSCNYDYKHCFHVAHLSENIFDQLNELHQLPKENKEYLIAAAKLHDIGFHISHSKHHKHSQYIIVNSEIMGFNENEIRTIACIARYHRKSHPKDSHEEYMLLPAEWKIIVKKLSAILRIADAFDRTHNFLVKYINVEINKNSVVFQVENKLEDLEIELWSIDRKKQLFEEFYNKKVIVKSFS
ncbi:MAG: Ppx/GppA family phosphatase [Ignavibacteriales bacterium]|nr:Ppx/GppA family phosphatase [Ignavibacteriales bacterium]MCB9260455.1 Ppx/GppA family phosphatase [Ignavibacteriales bacterium]